MKIDRAILPFLLVNFGMIGYRLPAVHAYRSWRCFSRKSQGYHNRYAQSFKNVPGITSPLEQPILYATSKSIPGTNLRILKYPHPQLRADNALVTEFDDSLKNIVQAMLHVMYKSKGIGLAAPQVGINKRIMVFNHLAELMPRSVARNAETVLINPKISQRSENIVYNEEQCLSFPRIAGEVGRSDSLNVCYQTESGEKREKVMEGDEAIVFQHEYDHLDGVFLIDHFNEEDRARNQVNLDKLISKYGPGGAV